MELGPTKKEMTKKAIIEPNNSVGQKQEPQLQNMDSVTTSTSTTNMTKVDAITNNESSNFVIGNTRISNNRIGSNNSNNNDISSEDIYHYTQSIAASKRRFTKLPQGQLAIQFLDKLKIYGISDGRICTYATQLSNLLKLFATLKTTLIQDVTKQDCEYVLSQIISKNYSGTTKVLYALSLIRFVHYVKTGEIGTHETGYAPEVSWIKPNKYLNKNSDQRKIQPEDLLSPQELFAIINKTDNKRDRAMLWVMFEGALRPGELLRLKVGGVIFKANHVLISTTGKTGPKRVPLVTSFKPLMEWLEVHPGRDDPNAPLWHSFSNCSKTKRITYVHLRSCLKLCAQEANIKKRVWNYLFRHTQLTALAKKLSDQTLGVFGNWTPGSDMTKVYVHLSGEDVENAVLQLHGIEPQGNGGDANNSSQSVLSTRQCPRCSESNTPEVPRCVKCGLILDEKLLIQTTVENDGSNNNALANNMLQRLEKVEQMGTKIDLILNRLADQKPVQIPAADDVPTSTTIASNTTKRKKKKSKIDDK